ncbi:ethylene-responsive transcription factor ERF118 [Trifolium repens]|nr:ethylene-responsive transcription factor ERF118 [Trifolium repens]
MNSNDTSLDQIGTCSNKVRVSGNSRKNIVGVTKRKSGKYAVKVYDRIRKKDLWLGTFDTEEEASVVYLSKKTELEEELHASVIKAGKRTSKYVGVWRRDSGKFAAHIRDPIRKKKLYLGSFVSEEEAAEAYLAKKAELAVEVKGKGNLCMISPV